LLDSTDMPLNSVLVELSLTKEHGAYYTFIFNAGTTTPVFAGNATEVWDWLALTKRIMPILNHEFCEYDVLGASTRRVARWAEET